MSKKIRKKKKLARPRKSKLKRDISDAEWRKHLEWWKQKDREKREAEALVVTEGEDPFYGKDGVTATDKDGNHVMSADHETFERIKNLKNR